MPLEVEKVASIKTTVLSFLQGHENVHSVSFRDVLTYLESHPEYSRVDFSQSKKELKDLVVNVLATVIHEKSSATLTKRGDMDVSNNSSSANNSILLDSV
jgi:hypothetical protein